MFLWRNSLARERFINFVTKEKHVLEMPSHKRTSAVPCSAAIRLSYLLMVSISCIQDRSSFDRIKVVRNAIVSRLKVDFNAPGMKLNFKKNVNCLSTSYKA